MAQLRRGIPEVRLLLPVDQLVHRRARALPLEPPRAVVGTRVGAVVRLTGDVQAELLERLLNGRDDLAAGRGRTLSTSPESLIREDRER